MIELSSTELSGVNVTLDIRHSFIRHFTGQYKAVQSGITYKVDYTQKFIQFGPLYPVKKRIYFNPANWLMGTG